MIETAVGYIRVSTKGQERQSPESQYKDIMRWLNDKSWKFKKERLQNIEIELDEHVTGYKVRRDNPEQPEFEVTGIFTESGSGWKPESRDAFNKMIDHIRENEIKHLIVGWTDRLYRNPEEFGLMLRKLRKAHALDVHFHIVNENSVFSFAEGEDLIERQHHGSQMLQSEMESIKKSIRITKAHQDRYEIGRHTHKPPYGYRSKIDPETRALYVEIEQEEAQTLNLIFGKIASGEFTPSSLTKWLRENGYKKRTYNRSTKTYEEKPFALSSLNYMLKNERYLGRVKLHGKSKDTLHIPQIIEPEIFEKVQQSFQSHRKRRGNNGKGKSYYSPLASLCSCHFCNCQITTDPTTNSYGKTYNYLRCTNGKIHRNPDWYEREFRQKLCPQPYYREEKVSETIDHHFHATWLTDDDTILNLLKEELIKGQKDPEKNNSRLIKELDEQKIKLDKRLKGFEIMKADGEISKARYLDHKTEILSELNSIEKKVSVISASTVNTDDEIKAIMDFILNLREYWPTFSLEEKAEVLRIMAKKIILGKVGDDKHTRKAVKIIWAKPWDALAYVQGACDEIKQSLMEQKQQKDREAKSSIEKNWYARQDSNLRPSDS